MDVFHYKERLVPFPVSEDVQFIYALSGVQLRNKQQRSGLKQTMLLNALICVLNSKGDRYLAQR